jgi:hypothetical protein
MSSDRGTRSILVLAGGGLLVVLLGGVLVGGFGLRGAQRDETGSALPSTTARSAVSTSTTAGTTTAPSPTTVAPPAPFDGVDVHMDAGPIDAFDTDQPLVDGLPARSLLRITATGFETNGTGFVEQCTVTRCANQFPVVFDMNGMAHFQYLVSDTFAAVFGPASTCRADEPPCVVHVRGNDHSAFLTTFFRDAAPAPRGLTVTPNARDLVVGDRVRITATGFNPGERVQAMLCAAPATHGSDRCGAPGPVSSFTIDAGGSGRTELEIRAGRVGSNGARCGHGATCGIVVSHAGSSVVPAPVVEIAFATGPGAGYDATRTLVGLGAAIALIALAMFWVRSTDWRKPSEADTPDLDRIVLTGEEL